MLDMCINAIDFPHVYNSLLIHIERVDRNPDFGLTLVNSGLIRNLVALINLIKRDCAVSENIHTPTQKFCITRIRCPFHVPGISIFLKAKVTPQPFYILNSSLLTSQPLSF